jgi:hypothetical protein
MTDRQTPTARGEATTEQIPREKWEQFLHEFTEFNAEMPVRLQVVAPQGGPPDEGRFGLLADNQPLLDVTLDQEAGPPVIVIECGDPAAIGTGERGPAALRHVIQAPTALWARMTEPAGWDALEIESPDSSVILSLGPHPASPQPQVGAEKELLQAGWRSQREA